MQSPISIPKTADRTAEETLTNGGFFPDVALSEIRQIWRIDGITTPARLKEAVLEAMAWANRELAPLQAKATQTGATTLQALQPDTLNGEPIAHTRYRRAVGCWAMANLQERYRSIDTTKEGAEKANEFENSVDGLRRDARYAIRDLLGTPRWTVGLV